MSRATMTVEGFLAGDATLAYTQGGDAYLNLSVPHTPRRRNSQTNEWEDAGPTLWTRITLWKEQAEAFAPYAVKGALVTATGEPRLSEYTTREGKPGVNLELKRATVAVIPRQQARGGAAAATAAPAAGSWATGGGNGPQGGAWASPQEAQATLGGDPWVSGSHHPNDSETPF